jgi:uncharacterized membrane protein
MSLKQFRIIKAITAGIIAMLVSWSIVIHNFIIPFIAVPVVWAILFYCRGRVNEVIADERDYEIGGHAARWAIQIFSWIGIVIMLSLYAYQEVNPAFPVVAMTLAYSMCGLMLLYSILFQYYGRFSFAKNKLLYIILGIGLIFAFTIAGLRLFGGEDTWICQDGQWVMHGHPSIPMPTIKCGK